MSSPSFVPVNFDSSPYSHGNARDSGYTETGPRSSSPPGTSRDDDYHPPRVRFYSPSVRGPLVVSPSSKLLRDAPLLSSGSGESAAQFGGRCRLPDDSSFSHPPCRSLSPESEHLPLFAHARFLSDLPGLPLSRSPSLQLDPPQDLLLAEFHPPDPRPLLNDSTAYSASEYDTGYSSDGSQDSPCDILNYVRIYGQHASCDPELLESVTLSDILGDLFEGASPWDTLDEVLAVKSFQCSDLKSSCALSILAKDKRGVGYLSTAESLPTEHGGKMQLPNTADDANASNNHDFSNQSQELLTSNPSAAQQVSQGESTSQDSADRSDAKLDHFVDAVGDDRPSQCSSAQVLTPCRLPSPILPATPNGPSRTFDPALRSPCNQSELSMSRLSETGSVLHPRGPELAPPSAHLSHNGEIPVGGELATDAPASSELTRMLLVASRSTTRARDYSFFFRRCWRWESRCWAWRGCLDR